MQLPYKKYLRLTNRLAINAVIVALLFMFLNSTLLHTNLINDQFLVKIIRISLAIIAIYVLINKKSRNHILLKLKKLSLTNTDSQKQENTTDQLDIDTDTSEQTPSPVFSYSKELGDNVVYQKSLSGNVIPSSWPKLVRYYCLPILLFIFCWWLFSNNPFFKGNDFHLLTKELKHFDYYNGGTKNIIKGEKIKGTFTATENGLSALAVRLNTFERKNTDEITFRIQRDGDNGWYSEETYNSELFVNEVFYSFEFPKIINSLKQVYNFEIESTRGRGGNAVAISKSWPAYRVIYQPMTTGDGNSLQLNHYLMIKANSLLDSSDFRFSLVLSFSFILFYLAFLFMPKIQQIAYLTIAVYLLFVFWEMFYTVRNYDFNYLILTSLWLMITCFFGFKEQLSIKLGILFLFLCSIFVLLGNDLLAEKTSVWAYLYLLAGVFISGLNSLWNKRINVNKK